MTIRHRNPSGGFLTLMLALFAALSLVAVAVAQPVPLDSEPLWEPIEAVDQAAPIGSGDGRIHVIPSLSPSAVADGETLTVTAIVRSERPVASVTADLGGLANVRLQPNARLGGLSTDGATGIWTAEWKANGLGDQPHRAVLTITDTEGHSYRDETLVFGDAANRVGRVDKGADPSGGMLVIARNNSFDLGQNLSLGLIDPAEEFASSEYAYFGSGAQDGAMVKVELRPRNISPFIRGAIDLCEVPNERLSSAVIDAVNKYAYFGTLFFSTNDATVVKVALGSGNAPPTRVGTLSLPVGEGALGSATIDPANGYAYFGTTSSPAKVHKVKLGVGDSPPTLVSTLTLNEGEEKLVSAVIDPANGYAYFGTAASPGQVVKVALGAGNAPPTRVGALTLDSGENNLRSALIDPTNGYAYFGTAASPGRVVKVALGAGNAPPTRVDALSLNSEDGSVTCAVIESGSKYAYFGTKNNTAGGRLVKVALEPSSATPTRVGAITLDNDNDYVISAVIDSTSRYVYIGTQPQGTNIPGEVVKVATRTGGVTVGLSPPAAVAAGAQWRVNNTGFNLLDSGTIESPVATDDYTIEFLDIPNWTTPVNQSVTVSEGQITSLTARYQSGGLTVSIEPTGAIQAGAQWRRSGTNIWLESGATETPVATGSHTVEFKQIIGWSTPQDQPVTVTDGQTASLTGRYESGELTVTLAPPAAVSAGAQWRRTGTADWKNSGDKEVLPPDDYTVEFKQIIGWSTPQDQPVTVTDGQTVSLTGRYESGELTVALSPPSAVTAGAQWRRTGTADWKNSGDTEVLPPDDYTVEFKPIDDWTTPENQPVTVADGQIASLMGRYESGGLTVTLSPTEAVDAGAQWRRSGTEVWRNSGDTEPILPTGDYTVEFKPIVNWTTPDNQLVTVTDGQTASLTGLYESGGLTVTIEPTGAVQAGAQWRRLDTEVWNNSGHVEASLLTGDYTVEFKPIANWTAPENQVVTVLDGEATQETGTYSYAPASLNISDVNQRHSPPYLVEYDFALRDSVQAVVADAGDLSLLSKENGTAISPTETASFVANSANKELKVVLVLDYTRSMTDIASNGDTDGDGISDAVEAMEEAAEVFINRLQSNIPVALYEFHRADLDPILVARMSYDRTYTIERLGAIWTEIVAGRPGASRCWDAVYAGMQVFAPGLSPYEQRLVVFLSDGKDESSFYLPSNLITEARARGVQLYSLGFGAELVENALRSIAQSTGGRYYEVTAIDQFIQAFEAIIWDLQGRYTVRWATLKRFASRTFTPSFELSGWTRTATFVDNSTYNPDDYAGPVERGVLLLTTANISDSRAEVYLRAGYIPRYISQIRFTIRTQFPVELSLLQEESNGLCAGWTLETTPVADGLLVDLRSPSLGNPDGELPYAAFGPIMRLQIDDLQSLGDLVDPALFLVEMDNSIYSDGNPITSDPYFDLLPFNDQPPTALVTVTGATEDFQMDVAADGTTTGGSPTLRNPGTAPMEWAVDTAPAWLTVAPTSGTLQPGGSITLSLIPSASAMTLPTGDYNGSITISNYSNPVGDYTVPVSLTVKSLITEESWMIH